MGTEILCQPTQASSSSSGLVLLARMRLRSFRDRHFSLPSTCLQYLPLPYMPSSLLASSVNFLRSASLLGAGAVSDSLSNRNFLASSGGNFMPSKRRASSANWVTAAVNFSLACAAMVSVSSVMKFCCTHPARLARTARSSSWASAFFMNAWASATVAVFADRGVFACAAGFLGVLCAMTVQDNSRRTVVVLTMADLREDLRIRFENIAPPWRTKLPSVAVLPGGSKSRGNARPDVF